MKEYPETHQQGLISLENADSFPLRNWQDMKSTYIKGDFGIQIAKDGRVWICIDGIAFLRFSPHPNGKMSKE